MAEFNNQDFAINLKLLKRCGFFQIFNPNGKTILNFKIYLLSFIVFTVITQIIVIFGIIGLFYDVEDTTTGIDIILCLNIFLQNYLSLWKVIIFVFKNNTAWKVLFDVTRLNFMTSKRCREHINIIYECRDKVIKVTNIYFVLLVFICVEWALYPLVINITTMHENDDKKCLLNIFNIRFPIAMHTYNQYYIIFYVMEMAITIFTAFIVITTDIYLISLCLIINSQYRILTRAFENIGYEEKLQITGISNYYEDFQSIIIDQQRLYLQVKSYYSVIKPIVLGFFAVNSASSILLTLSIIWICSSVESISIMDVLKLVSTALLYYIQMFFYCYFFGNIDQNVLKYHNNQNSVQSVNQSIYFCNWTEMNLKFKKLLLLTMRLNDVNPLMIKVTQRKIVNLSLFTSIMTTCYNIVSVLLKTISNKKQGAE